MIEWMSVPRGPAGLRLSRSHYHRRPRSRFPHGSQMHGTAALAAAGRRGAGTGGSLRSSPPAAQVETHRSLGRRPEPHGIYLDGPAGRLGTVRRLGLPDDRWATVIHPAASVPRRHGPRARHRFSGGHSRHYSVADRSTRRRHASRADHP
jgi:hypothetical protein